MDLQPFDIVSGLGGNYLILEINYHYPRDNQEYYSFRVLNEKMNAQTLLESQWIFKKVARLTKIKNWGNTAENNWRLYDTISMIILNKSEANYLMKLFNVPSGEGLNTHIKQIIMP